MTRKTLAVIAVVVLLVLAAFVAGYWPQHQRGVSLQTDNDAMRERIEILENRARLSVIHTRALDAIDAVAAMNYGEAQQLSSSLFDEIRAELNRTTAPPYPEALQGGLNRRDTITSALATGDAAALEPLRELEKQIREVLSAPVTAPA
jgi:hypothetical protein